MDADAESAETHADHKIKVRLRPIGNTKRLANPTFNVKGHHQFSAVVTYIQRQLQMPPDQTLFCYINASFSPAPDVSLDDLHRSYAVDGVLNVNYCASVAFG